MKSRLKVPKNRKFVNRRHTCTTNRVSVVRDEPSVPVKHSKACTWPLWKMSLKLKYRENGDTRSKAHAAVVMNDPVKYKRDTTGISLYHSNGSPAKPALSTIGVSEEGAHAVTPCSARAAGARAAGARAAAGSREWRRVAASTV